MHIKSHVAKSLMCDKSKKKSLQQYFLALSLSLSLFCGIHKGHYQKVTQDFNNKIVEKGVHVTHSLPPFFAIECGQSDT